MREWLVRQTHISWQIAWFSGGVVAGIGLSLTASTLFSSMAWPLTAVFLFIAVMLRHVRLLALVALAAGVLLGLWHGVSGRQALAVYRPYYRQMVIMSGRIGEDASYGSHGDQRVRLREVKIDRQALPGEVWLSTNRSVTLKRGDTAVVQGGLGPGFGTVPATMFRAQVLQIIHPRPGDVARAVRDWFVAGVRRAIPEPQASLGVGYLVGQRSVLPPALDEQFRVVGLTHAVVASGYNLTILVSMARRRLMGVSKYLATLAGGLLVATFILITGLSPSMSRAGLVSALGLLAWYYGRKIHPLVLLPLAAAVTSWLRPAYVWGDIGWYLSFAAFAGVIVLAPLLHGYFWGNHPPSSLRQILVETIAAQIATLPIILFMFGQYSVYALPANLLVLPLVPLAMLCTFVAGLAGVCLPDLAAWAGWPATVLLRYTTWTVERIAALPGAQSTLHITITQLVAAYGLLMLVALHMWRQTRVRFRELPDD